MFRVIPPDEYPLIGKKLAGREDRIVCKAQWKGRIVVVKEGVSEDEVYWLVMVVMHVQRGRVGVDGTPQFRMGVL